MGLCQSKTVPSEPIIVISNDNQASTITEIDLTKRRIVVIRGGHGKIATSMLTHVHDDAERRDVSFSI
jgi:hypothetical protein